MKMNQTNNINVDDLIKLSNEHGMSFVPVPYKEKNPNQPDWQKNGWKTRQELEQAFGRGKHNVGVLLGEDNGRIIDIDLDCGVARKLGPKFLPPTRTFGRESSLLSHYLYRVDQVPKTKKVNGINGDSLLELRGSRHQTLIPPSMHPTGEAILWSNGDPLTELTGKELETVFNKLALGTLLATYWPEKGIRDETAMALAGALLNQGWTMKDTEHFIGSVCEIAGDEEWAIRQGKAKATDEKIKQGEQVTGLPTLVEILGKDVGNKIAEYLPSGSPQNQPQTKPQNIGSPPPATIWDQSVCALDYINQEEEEQEMLWPNLLARGSLTQIFAPRGIGKSLYVLHIAVTLARQGKKILLIDTDNSSWMIKKRLRSWIGPDQTIPKQGLKVIDRNKAPQLTDKKAYSVHDFTRYDLVIVDCLDSTAEGIGEKDSSKPTKALSPLLDMAHGDHGPAVLLIGNVTKDGTRGRGSGTIMDRADAFYEIRDWTGVVGPFSLDKTPDDNASEWQARNKRRSNQTVYRLMFACNKYRMGEEPEPFVIELDLSNPVQWTAKDITAQISAESSQARVRERNRKKREQQTLMEDLRKHSKVMQENGTPWKKQGAMKFLRQDRGCTDQQARTLITDAVGGNYICIQEAKDEKGKPKYVLPVGGISRESLSKIPSCQTSLKTSSYNSGISGKPINRDCPKSPPLKPSIQEGSQEDDYYRLKPNDTKKPTETIMGFTGDNKEIGT